MRRKLEPEMPLGGGWVTGGVVRVGETVHRPSGPRAEFVHRLLQHLEEVSFGAAPRFLGFDERKREIRREQEWLKANRALLSS